MPFEMLRQEIRAGTILGRLLRYDEVRLLTPDLDTMTRPFLTGVLARLLARGRAVLVDDTGRERVISLPLLARWCARVLRDWIRLGPYIRGVTDKVECWIAETERPREPRNLELQFTPVYIRADPTRAIVAGGSVAHTAGVINQLGRFAGAPLFLTTTWLPMVREEIETHAMPLATEFLDFSEVPHLFQNDVILESAGRILRNRRVSFVYQRYLANCYAGVEIARSRSIPFVLEYNGSEIWMRRHWETQRFKYEDISERIEILNLRFADLVVVVSEVMREELLGRGIPDHRILVNPNGVDPDRYSPEVDGSAVRERYGLEGCTVLGFIGTFRPWHGAQVLAAAFGRLIRRRPEYRGQVKGLLIGAGVQMREVKRAIADLGIEADCILTGLVPQEDGPAHLAACDVLVSPHVPNADGSRFFGSPTKLFEYMAMGRGIVASDLEQIGEVLRHGETAWLVAPNDADALAAGLERLVDDRPLRQRLGEAARRQAIAEHTWEQHTRRIVEKLRELCA